MKERAHAELIKRWADGCEIQYRKPGTDRWVDAPEPAWVADYEYRVKPAELKRVYPITGMTNNDLSSCWAQASNNIHFNGWTPATACAHVILAGFRHAIDNGQVVTREEFDRAIGDRTARDFDVARVVQEAAIRRFLEAPVGYRTRAIREADLAAIIAEVGK